MIPWNGNRGEKRHRRLIETFRTHRRREPRSIFSKNTNRKQREETETEREGGKERERETGNALSCTANVETMEEE